MPSGSDASEDSTRRTMGPPGAAHTGPRSSPDAAPTLTLELAPPDEAPLDRRIGRFTVLEPLGRGGMGMVVAAYDEHLDRKVAVKVLHQGRTGDADDQQRLQREAQALARLSHPNVVTVHEVGRHEGAVFVAMEFIRGQSLSAWQRTEPGWPAVLEAYVQAGRGLQAAHEAELVHRDFKPHNVMRTDDGVVKVLDFGMARLVADRSTEESALVVEPRASLSSLTRSGTVMGTPAYMAPEQHEGEHVDARSDQYGYCVALWEGLTGTRPFAEDSYEGMVQAKHQGAPRWPDDAPVVPRIIVEALRRGLSPNARDRWPSMEALLEVLRWDPSRRRRRWALGLAGVAVVGLGGATVLAWADARAERCEGARTKLAGIWDEDRRAEAKAAVLGVDRPYAPGVWSRAEQRLDEYADAWVAMHTEACEATAIRAEQSVQQLDLRMGCLRRASLDLAATVDTLSDADADVVDGVHELVAGLRPLSRCADTEALEAEVEPPLPHEAEAVEQVRRRLARSRSERAAGRPSIAQAEVEAAARLLEGVEYGPVHAQRALEEGYVLDDLGKYDEAEAALNEALERASRENLDNECRVAAERLMYVVGYQQERTDEGLRYWPILRGLSDEDPERDALARHTLGQLLSKQGKYAEAEAEHRAALSLREKALGPDHPSVANSRNSLGAVISEQGKYEEAEAEYRAALASWEKTLGPDHPHVAKSRNNLGLVLESRGKYEEAEAEHRAALASWERALGPDHPHVAISRNNLGNVLEKQGKYEEAEAEKRAALSSMEKALGPDHPNVGMLRANLGSAFARQGRYEEAEVEYRAGLSLLEKALGPEHPSIARSHNNLGIALNRQGKYEEAEAEHRVALSLREKTLGPEHPSIATSHNNLGEVFSAQGRYEEAEAEHRAALSLREKTLGPDHPHIAESRASLASLLLTVGRADEALELAQKAWTRHRREDIVTKDRAQTAFLLARILWSVDAPARDRARARSLALDAVASYRVATGDPAQALAEVEQWLDRHRAP